jgi:hypothetical protein
MARVFKRGEFVALKTVSATGENVNDNRCDGQIRQNRQIA